MQPPKRPRRIGAEHSETRIALLDATQRLMLDEGYGAVSTRRVARALGLTSATVHYYFPTTDDLLVAVFRRAADATMTRLADALADPHPLRALWTLSTDAGCTALALEFMALANHRKRIRAELAASAQQFRDLHADGLARIIPRAALGQMTPLGVTILMASVSRLLVMEQSLGITLGHTEAQAAMAVWLGQMEPERLQSPQAA